MFGRFLTATDTVWNADPSEAIPGEFQSWMAFGESLNLSHKIQVSDTVLGHRPRVAFDQFEQRLFLDAEQFLEVLASNPNHLGVFVVKGSRLESSTHKATEKRVAARRSTGKLDVGKGTGQNFALFNGGYDETKSFRSGGNIFQAIGQINRCC